MRPADRQRLDQLAAIANLPDPATSATAPGTQVLSVDQRIQGVIGQNYPRLAEGQQWVMSNNALYYSGRAHDQRLTLLELASATQQQLVVQLLAGATATSDKVLATSSGLFRVLFAGNCH